jgi:hypothetical protein
MTDRTPFARLLFLSALVLVALPVVAIAQVAHYSVTFETTWTNVTHPTDYPPQPHFSGLVGGTHDNTVSFWNTGELASLGIKRMAEWGSQADLLDEVQTAIDGGQAHATISDVPLWDVPGSTSVDIELTPDFPLVTLVAMIAPSPDWFIGVRNLDLAPGGVWAEEIVIDLFAYDAGTDSGPTYTSNDQPTVPPVPVFAITGYPFEPGVPLGTFTFTKNYVSDVPDVVAGFTANAYPNPFNPQTTIAWEMPSAGPLRVEIHDVKGRVVRRLWQATTDAGPGQVMWNGRDDSGGQVGSGLYFARLIRPESVLTRKLSLVK